MRPFRIGVWVIGVCLGIVGIAQSSWADILHVDDFDKGEKPNALGGDFGAWNKDAADPTQYCRNTFDKNHAYGGVGYSLRLDYDVDSPNPAYNGFWSKLQGADLRPYKALTFYVRGDQAKGYPSQVKLELKTDKDTGKVLVKGITDQWQKMTVPLKEFAGLNDPSKVSELVLVFDDMNTNKKVGTIYLDEIAFE